MTEKPDENNPVLLEIGKILKPHGLNGELIVNLSTNRNERLNPGSVISTQKLKLNVRTSRPHQKKFIVHFDGIENRIMAIPTEEGLFRNIGFVNNKLFYSVRPDEGSFGDIPWYDFSSSDKSTILFYDLEANKEKVFMPSISSFTAYPQLDSILIKSKDCKLHYSRIRCVSKSSIHRFLFYYDLY